MMPAQMYSIGLVGMGRIILLLEVWQHPDRPGKLVIVSTDFL
jgi:hypothetical protein